MLVPASMFLVSPAQAQETPTLDVINGGTHDIPLKAIQDSDGDIKTQDDFEIEADNVITVVQSRDFHVIPSEGSLFAIKITDEKRETSDLVFSRSDGRVTQALSSKAYLLDIIVLLDGDKYLYETVLAVLAPGQTLNQVNTQNIIQNFISSTSETHTTVVFKDDNDNDDNEEEPSICFFDPNDEECDPDENGDCAEGFGRNEDGRCIPQQACPQGFHRANDDETGRCIDEDVLRQCENNGGWVEEGEFCPEDELPFCNVDHSNEPCISGQEETEPTTTTDNATSTEQEQTQNEEDEPLDSNCGGVPCTASEKEDSWTSDVPESSPGVPITPTPEPEPETTDSEETEEREEEAN